VAIGVCIIGPSHSEAIFKLDEAGHRVRTGAVHPDLAVVIDRHKPKCRIDTRIDDCQVESERISNPIPIMNSCSAERVDTQFQATRPYRIHVKNITEVIDVGRHEVISTENRTLDFIQRYAPDACDSLAQ
jgi:hypothetical protein